MEGDPALVYNYAEPAAKGVLKKGVIVFQVATAAAGEKGATGLGGQHE